MAELLRLPWKCNWAKTDNYFVYKTEALFEVFTHFNKQSIKNKSWHTYNKVVTVQSTSWPQQFVTHTNLLTCKVCLKCGYHDRVCEGGCVVSILTIWVVCYYCHIGRHQHNIETELQKHLEGWNPPQPFNGSRSKVKTRSFQGEFLVVDQIKKTGRSTLPPGGQLVSWEQCVVCKHHHRCFCLAGETLTLCVSFPTVTNNC